jgi:hypothetical protein
VPRKPQRPFVPHHTPTAARPPSAAPEFRLYRPFLPGVERGTVEPVAFAARDYQQNTGGDLYASDAEEEPEELPPVEHFLDPLPSVNDFAPEAERHLSESGWVETDWQHYDWRAAAALGEASVDEASTAWDATNWDKTGHRAREPRQSAAQAIATALDEIARRIREGDLSPSGPGPMTDPATIAATLAALLGVRR